MSQEAGIVGCLHLRFGCLFMMCSTPFVALECVLDVRQKTFPCDNRFAYHRKLKCNPPNLLRLNTDKLDHAMLQTRPTCSLETFYLLFLDVQQDVCRRGILFAVH